MSTINESELTQSHKTGDCMVCFENDGDIYLCGEGYMCTECYSTMAEIDEAEAFTDEGLVKENRDKIRGKLAQGQIDAQS